MQRVPIGRLGACLTGRELRRRLFRSGTAKFGPTEIGHRPAGALVQPAGKHGMVCHLARLAGEIDKHLLADLARPVLVAADAAQCGRVDEVEVALDEGGKGLGRAGSGKIEEQRSVFHGALSLYSRSIANRTWFFMCGHRRDDSRVGRGQWLISDAAASDFVGLKTAVVITTADEITLMGRRLREALHCETLLIFCDSLLGALEFSPAFKVTRWSDIRRRGHVSSWC